VVTPPPPHQNEQQQQNMDISMTFVSFLSSFSFFISFFLSCLLLVNRLLRNVNFQVGRLSFFSFGFSKLFLLADLDELASTWLEYDEQVILVVLLLDPL
jgi:hypothetical protein